MIHFKRKLRSWSFALPLIPVFFVMQHVGPDGIPEAEGCGGSGSTVPNKYVELSWPPGEGGASESPTGKVAVATDAFFLMTTTNFAIDPAAVTVTATTSAGAVVAGTVKVLTDEAMYPRFSWSANDALEVGTMLQVAMSPTGMPEVATEAELEVVGPPAELSAAGLTLARWSDVGHGTGPKVSCSYFRQCQPAQEVMVSTAEELLHTAEYRWEPPDIDGFVLWQATLERSDGDAGLDDLVTPDPQSYDNHNLLSSMALSYPKSAKRYCAKLTVRDLRTDQVKTSELCSALGDIEEVYRYQGLSQCADPPAGFEAAWCLHHGDDPRCFSMSGPARVDATPEKESSGCQVSPGASRASCFGLFVALTAVVGALGRRRSAS